MRVVGVALQNFRSYETAQTRLGEHVSVVFGANGAGKTNLIEALYFGCTGRSCRTTSERDVVRFGARTARVDVDVTGGLGVHRFSAGFTPGEPKRLAVDGRRVERLLDAPQRPLISVFFPDRLELVKGVPSLRRAHLDQFVAGLWPARVLTRQRYAQILGQRNALLARLRAGVGSRPSLTAWDQALSECAVELMADRRAAAEHLVQPFAEMCSSLGLDGDPRLAYNSRSNATDATDFAAELRERHTSDIERGFTDYGPHRDDLTITRHGRQLRRYGSQGQQRLGLLALLLAERSAIVEVRETTPLILLDDVMSELDEARRRSLVGLLETADGQAVITTTDIHQVPLTRTAQATCLKVAGGAITTPDISEVL